MCFGTWRNVILRYDESFNDFILNEADDEGSVLESAVNYPNIFFLMHKWFTTSESLANDLWQLFESGKPSYHGDYLSLLATIQQSAKTDANGSQEIGPSSRPPSVILSRKQVRKLIVLIL